MSFSFLRSASLGLALATSVSIFPQAAAASEKPREITVGYLNLVNAQLVTKNLGLISKEMPGVKINYIKVGGGGDMLRAIAAKQVDFGGLGNPPTAIGVTRGLPIREQWFSICLVLSKQWLSEKVQTLSLGKT